MMQLAQKPSRNLAFSWEDLLGLLRDELQEYGGLLGLLDAQQQNILNRRPDGILEINQSVQNQMEASQILLKRRESFVSSLAQCYGESSSSTLSELLPHFPEVTKPLFESLIEEINKLISQVRRKIEQNQRLLNRLTEVTDKILSIASPSSHSKTYTRSGNLNRLSSDRSSLNESA